MCFWRGKIHEELIWKWFVALIFDNFEWLWGLEGFRVLNWELGIWGIENEIGVFVDRESWGFDGEWLWDVNLIWFGAILTLEKDWGWKP